MSSCVRMRKWYSEIFCIRCCVEDRTTPNLARSKWTEYVRRETCWKLLNCWRNQLL